jgi:hypothetical protein
MASPTLDGLGRGSRAMESRTRSGPIAEGIAAGVLGAAMVALWFLILDMMAGVPFRTPALLGAALFDGVRDPAMVAITPRLVLGYTAVHLALFIAFGLGMAGLFAVAELQPKVLFAIFMLLCCLVVVSVAAVAVLAHWIFDVMAPWTVLTGALLAAVAMAALLVWRHPRLLPHARRAGE